MNKFDIFDFEQSIMHCWNITTDLRYVYEKVIESNSADVDEITNALLGIETLYEIKFNKLFADFESLCREYHEMRKVVNKNEN